MKLTTVGIDHYYMDVLETIYEFVCDSRQAD